jgi:hypothetical protein
MKDHPLPDDLRELDGLLRQVRFQPRSSLEPEVVGRAVRQEEPSIHSSVSTARRFWPALIPVGITVAVGLAFFLPDRRVVVDRCCYDLDGGGTPDDGAVVIAERDGRVHQLSVYEDSDGSRRLSAADIVRFERSGLPVIEQFLLRDLTSIRHCCEDLDGGGPPDDGILVLASPPDRIHTAAIYELR